jgi:hypothetical protein
MSKSVQSKLDRFTASLDEWFGIQKLSLEDVQKKLLEDGCSVSLSRLSRWWERRQEVLAQEKLLQQIATGAKQCKEMKEAFAEHPAPELETIMSLHRVLIMQLSTQSMANPALLEMADRLTRTVLEFVSGQTRAKQKERELSLAEGKWAWIQKEDLDKALDALHAEIKDNPSAVAAFKTFKASMQRAER